MKNLYWWLVDLVCRALEPGERDVVLGDFLESGESGRQALVAVLGLALRRQAELWKDWRPWLAATLVVPSGFVFCLLSRRVADSSGVNIWLYANNWDWTLLRHPGFWYVFVQSAGAVLVSYLALFCQSWSIGLVLAAVCRRSRPVHATIFGLMLLGGQLLGVPPVHLGYALSDRAREFSNNNAAFDLTFYRVIFPVLLQLLLVLLPAMWAMQRAGELAHLRPRFRAAVWIAAIVTSAAMVIHAGLVRPPFIQPGILQISQTRLMQFIVYWPIAYLAATAIARRGPSMKVRTNMYRVCALIAFLTAGIVTASGQSFVRAALRPSNQRKAAPAFSLQDNDGKTATLKEYQGKVLVLDFWATWCTGCKQEIPWFVDFQQRYGKEGLAVVGVSMDEGGWAVLKPFLAAAKIPYRMLLGNGPMMKRYGAENLPDTFVIDRKGRVAAAYMAGLVDRDNIEANIKAVLSDRE